MTISCASELTTTTPQVTVPGSVTLEIDLSNTAATGTTDLEFVLLDPTLAVCFGNGARVVRVKKIVPSIGHAVSETLQLICCSGNLHHVNTALPIGLNVWEKGALRCSPSLFVTVISHACGGVLTPLHKTKTSPLAKLLVPAAPGLTAFALATGATKAAKKSAMPKMKKGVKQKAKKGTNVNKGR